MEEFNKTKSPGSILLLNEKSPQNFPYINGIYLTEGTHSSINASMIHNCTCSWCNLSHTTVNKDHKILNSPAPYLWSWNNVINFPIPMACFVPTYSPGWTGVLPQGEDEDVHYAVILLVVIITKLIVFNGEVFIKVSFKKLLKLHYSYYHQNGEGKD